MGGYTNGNFPLSMMVGLASEHYLPAGTAARWRWMVAQAKAKYGVTLTITPGWNAYRPYAVQVQYRAELGIMAAWPGTSSHGLIYNGQLCAAIDVHNWAQLGWARFKALCRLAGFTVDFVTPQELWHIGDFNDIWTVPVFAAGGNASKPATPDPITIQEDEMSYFRIGDNGPCYVVGINDAQGVTQDEATALARMASGTGTSKYKDGTLVFRRISAAQAKLIIDGVKFRRTRHYEAIAKAVGNTVAPDLASINAGLDQIAADIAALGDVEPTDVE